MKERLHTFVIVLVLVGVGALLGSFWLEWRDDRLGEGENARDPASEADRLEERIRVEILNGAGVSGVAREATVELRSLGFDVVYFGNADDFDHPVTVVLDRVGNDSVARRVADALGVDSVATEVDPELYLDATVILGGDWSGVSGSREGGGAPD